MPKGILYLCPTPIGNLEDITQRVLKTLAEVNLIAAEDTRHTRKLLTHFDIHTPITSYHEHNKHKKTPHLMKKLSQGESLALVCDAGMPGIADPGHELVFYCVEEGVTVVPLPGANAAVTALAASGLPSHSFAFYGFPASKGKQRRELFSRLLHEEKTVIFYESPHRLVKTLSELATLEEGRQAVVARELTKIHEEFVRGTLLELKEHFLSNPPRGECTVLLAPSAREKKEDSQEPQMTPDEKVQELIEEGLPRKEAIKEAARQLGLRRQEVYRQVCIKKKDC